MAARERRTTQFLIDWIHEEMGALANPPVYARMKSARQMLQRWLDKDLKRRERLDGRH